MARDQVPRFMRLTASIVQNKPDELVPLLELATGGKQEYQTKKQFRKRHIKKEVSETRGIFGGKTYETKLVRAAQLRASVGGSIHYIEDLDATKKPVKDVETVEVPMSSAQIKQYRKAMKGRSLRAAVNAKCLDCSCWQRTEVRDCPVVNCPLYPYRPYQAKGSKENRPTERVFSDCGEREA